MKFDKYNKYKNSLETKANNAQELKKAVTKH